MSEAPSVKDLLQGGGAPTASFDERQPPTGVGARPGLFYEGRVVKEEIVQATKMAKQGETPVPEFWDPPHNTRPKWQIILTVQNPSYVTSENEEGLMRIFLKGGALQASQKRAKELNVETFLHGFARLTWTGTQPSKTPGYNDTKLYDFQFQPGVDPVRASVVTGAPQQQAPQQPQFPQPPQQGFTPGLPAGAVPQETWAPSPAPQVGGPAFPPPPMAGAAAVTSILGGVEITPLDPTTEQQVAALIGAGLRDAAAIEAAFRQHNLQPPSIPQIQRVLDNTPF